MSIAAARIERYYDTHDIEGEEMGQNNFHFNTIQYLVSLLKWLYRGQQVYIGGELNLYRTPNRKEVPLTPDVLVIKGIAPIEERDQEFSSYYVNVDGPPPALVIEVSNPKTWRDDLEVKPTLYAAMGIQECFVFDPHSRPLWTKEWRKRGRLTGFRLDPLNSKMPELGTEQPGQLWSEQLQSRLVVEDRDLRLYDQDGQLHLTEAQAERKRADRLAEFLREQGFNPDNVV